MFSNSAVTAMTGEGGGELGEDGGELGELSEGYQYYQGISKTLQSQCKVGFARTTVWDLRIEVVSIGGTIFRIH